jgi:hypothetical protein
VEPSSGPASGSAVGAPPPELPPDGGVLDVDDDDVVDELGEDEELDELDDVDELDERDDDELELEDDEKLVEEKLGGGVTVTIRLSVRDSPYSSTAVKVTVYVPAAPNACVAPRLEAELPSPNAHETDSIGAGSAKAWNFVLGAADAAKVPSWPVRRLLGALVIDTDGRRSGWFGAVLHGLKTTPVGQSILEASGGDAHHQLYLASPQTRAPMGEYMSLLRTVNGGG